MLNAIFKTILLLGILFVMLYVGMNNTHEIGPVGRDWMNVRLTSCFAKTWRISSKAPAWSISIKTAIEVRSFPVGSGIHPGF